MRFEGVLRRIRRVWLENLASFSVAGDLLTNSICEGLQPPSDESIFEIPYVILQESEWLLRCGLRLCKKDNAVVFLLSLSWLKTGNSTRMICTVQEYII